MDISNLGSPKKIEGMLRNESLTAAPVVAASSLKEVQSQDARQQGSRAQLDSAVADIQKYMQSVSRNLNFSIDDSTGEVVVKIIDTDSGETLRQIPSEEALKMAARLEDMRGLMFEAQV